MIPAILLLLSVVTPDATGQSLADAIRRSDVAAVDSAAVDIVRSKHGGTFAWISVEPATAQQVVTALHDCAVDQVRELSKLQGKAKAYGPNEAATSRWHCGMAATDHPADEFAPTCYDVGYMLFAIPAGAKAHLRLLREDDWSTARCGAKPLPPAPPPLKREG